MARITAPISPLFPRPFSLTHLFLSLLLFLPTVVVAFTPTFTTNIAQCAEFTIQWTSSQAGPPFNLLVVPVNPPLSGFPDSTGLTGVNLSAPIQVAIPDSSWSSASSTGMYTISALPLRSGERFVVVMDDGFGLGTGGVSGIQTVSPTSGPTSCLGPIGSAANVLFNLSTFTPAQCQPLSITSGQASAIRGFVPGGSPFSLDLPAASTGNMTTTWDVNVATSTSFVLAYIGRDGKLASSGLIQTQGSAFGTACLVNAPHTTSGLSGTATDLLPSSSNSNSLPPASVSSSSGGGGGISTPVLIGGIIGALAFVGITALVIFFCIVRRTDALGRPKSRTTASRGEGRSTVEPYKSYDLTGEAGLLDGKRNGGGSGGSVGRKNTGVRRGNSTSPSTAVGAGGGAANLEARFGSGLFGRKKNRPNGGANRPVGTDDELTNSQRRAMYPGLSIASTQNRSVGVVSVPGGVGAGEDGYIEPTIPATPAVGGVVSAYREAKRREARTERELARRESDPSSSVSGAGSTSSTHITEEDRRVGGAGRRRGDLSAIHESSGYVSSTHMTPPNLPSQRGQRQRSVEDSAAYADGSSGAIPLDDIFSNNEKSAISNSNPKASLGSPLGATVAMGNTGRRPSTAPGSGAAPYHLPTSLLRSPGGDGGNVAGGGEVLRMHEYPPDTKEDLESSEFNWRSTRSVGVTTPGSHPYATAQSPHSDPHSSLFHSGTITSSIVESLSSRSGRDVGGGRGGAEARRGQHPYADPLNFPEIIRHTDAGPMMDDEDDEEEGGRRRVVELPPSYGDVTSSNRGRRRGNGGGGPGSG